MTGLASEKILFPSGGILAWKDGPEQISLRLDHGRCEILFLQRSSDMEASCESRLHPAERLLAVTLPPRRRTTWVAGRVALRQALQSIGEQAPKPIFSTPRGAPVLPAGVSGSISHKLTVHHAIAAGMAKRGEGIITGLDIELCRTPKQAIEPIVLSKEESAAIDKAGKIDRWLDVLIRFSAKEAVFKAIDPVVQKLIDYKDLSVFPEPSGIARLVWHSPMLGAGFSLEARWMMLGEVILTTACLARPEASLT